MFTPPVRFCLILILLSGCGSNLKSSPQDLSNVKDPGLSSASPSASNGLSDEENDFLLRINALRAQYDLPLLQLHPALQVAARKHSQYMNQNDLLSHSEPSPNESSSKRIQNAGGNFDVTGENIACGNDSASKTFDQWFASTGHLRNMLSIHYQYIGIAREGQDGDQKTKNCPYFWTTDFSGL